MVTLWSELHDLYGDKAEMKLGFVGETKFNQWKLKINRLPHDQLPVLVEGALKKLLGSKNVWPPELQEFLSLCLSVQDELRCKTMYKEFEALPKPVIDYSENGKGRAALRKLRAVIGLPA